MVSCYHDLVLVGLAIQSRESCGELSEGAVLCEVAGMDEDVTVRDSRKTVVGI